MSRSHLGPWRKSAWWLLVQSPNGLHAASLLGFSSQHLVFRSDTTHLSSSGSPLSEGTAKLLNQTTRWVDRLFGDQTASACMGVGGVREKQMVGNQVDFMIAGWQPLI